MHVAIWEVRLGVFESQKGLYIGFLRVSARGCNDTERTGNLEAGDVAATGAVGTDAVAFRSRSRYISISEAVLLAVFGDVEVEAAGESSLDNVGRKPTAVTTALNVCPCGLEALTSASD